MSEQRRTVCNRDCPDACGIVATVEDGRVVRLQGDPEHPVTKGFLCYRTGRFLATQYAPDRITTPLMRRGTQHVAVSWDEALEFVATRLLAIRAESGPAAIFHYRSGGSHGLLTGVVDHFFDHFGPVTKKRGDICSGAGEAAQIADFGVSDSHDIFDLLSSRHIILWGKNPVASSPHLVPILKEAQGRGAQVVLVDPVPHESVKLCDRYYPVRPGGDFALAMAVAGLLFDRGHVDRDAARYCDHLDGFARLVRSRSLAEWCSDADVDLEVAADLAERLGPGKPTAIQVGWGMARRRNGAAIVRALDALGAISGNLGVPGGGVSYYFARRSAFRSLDKAPPPRTVCEPRFADEVLSMADPPIRAVWITAGNPVAMLPDSVRVQEALRTRELVVVVDSWMSDTAREAHVVFPTTTLLEADDLLGSYGHHYLGVAQPVVAPPHGVLTDLQIIQALAARVGLADVMKGTAREWKERFTSEKLEPRGVTLESLEQAPLRNPLVPKVLFAGRRFPTATGSVQLMTEACAPATMDPRYPLKLMALSTRRSQASQWALGHPEVPVEVTVHPESSFGLLDGSVAWMESPVGRMRVRVCHDATQRRDVALVAKGGHLSRGACANALIRGETTDMGEGGVLYDEGVRLVAESTHA